jgi:4'-phosphopantetheinyl transferase
MSVPTPLPPSTFDRLPSRLIIAPADVHVVRFDLTADEDYAGTLALLDPHERARAVRFRDGAHRRAFVAAHAATRVALGRCLDIPPAGLRFAYGPRGKPELAGSLSDLRFNLSHAGDRSMLAIAVGRAVGIDIEREREIEALDIARRFFSPLEQSALASTSPDGRLAAFYRCWTRKESFIKASGDGLSRPLSAFDMSLDDEHGDSLLLACRDAPEDVARWTTVPLRAEPGYHAALTVEGHGWRLIEWSGL